MNTEADCIVIQDQVIVEGMAIFASSTGEIAWITGIEDNHICLKTVTESQKIPLSRFRRQIDNDEYALDAPPIGYSRLLQEALETVENDTARYHIREELQRLALLDLD